MLRTSEKSEKRSGHSWGVYYNSLVKARDNDHCNEYIMIPSKQRFIFLSRDLLDPASPVMVFLLAAHTDFLPPDLVP